MPWERGRKGGLAASYEQAQAKVRCVQGQKVAIALGPSPRSKIGPESAYRALLDLRPHSRPHGKSATHLIVQIRLGPAPVGFEEAVRAVPGNGDRLRPGSN